MTEKIVLSAKALYCAEQAANAIDTLTFKSNAGVFNKNFGILAEIPSTHATNSRAIATGIVAGKIGSQVFDACMAGEPIISNISATAQKTPK
jgi:hypothetical protein